MIYILLPLYYSLYSYGAKPRNANFRPFSPIIFAARCVAHRHLCAPASRPQPFTFASFLFARAAFVPFAWSVRPLSWSAPCAIAPLQGLKRANGRCSAFCVACRRPLWPRRPPDTAAAAHIPPTPPLWAARRPKLPPRIFFYFLFSIHPHFYFFLIPICCCFSIYIVFSFICPFSFDFSRSFVADDSFPICRRDMRLNRRFRVCAA